MPQMMDVSYFFSPDNYVQAPGSTQGYVQRAITFISLFFIHLHP